MAAPPSPVFVQVTAFLPRLQPTVIFIEPVATPARARSIMPRRTATVVVDASTETAFDLIHDYSRRLAWDSMLSEARLIDGASRAGLGVRSLCVGTRRSAYLPMETEYVSFRPGVVAAVKLTTRPALFDRFAATLSPDAGL